MDVTLLTYTFPISNLRLMPNEKRISGREVMERGRNSLRRLARPSASCGAVVLVVSRVRLLSSPGMVRCPLSKPSRSVELWLVLRKPSLKVLVLRAQPETLSEVLFSSTEFLVYTFTMPPPNSPCSSGEPDLKISTRSITELGRMSNENERVSVSALGVSASLSSTVL